MSGMSGMSGMSVNVFHNTIFFFGVLGKSKFSQFKFKLDIKSDSVDSDTWLQTTHWSQPTTITTTSVVI